MSLPPFVAGQLPSLLVRGLQHGSINVRVAASIFILYLELVCSCPAKYTRVGRQQQTSTRTSLNFQGKAMTGQVLKSKTRVANPELCGAVVRLFFCGERWPRVRAVI